MKTGVVRVFNEDQGFGIIIGDHKGIEYFVHVASLKSEILAGDKVQFNEDDSKKGKIATDVERMAP